jgi:hypothetical protein
MQANSRQPILSLVSKKNCFVVLVLSVPSVAGVAIGLLHLLEDRLAAVKKTSIQACTYCSRTMLVEKSLWRFQYVFFFTRLPMVFINPEKKTCFDTKGI